MKNAEEWIREYNSERHSFERKLMFSNGDLIRAIQVDAIRFAREQYKNLPFGQADDAILSRIRELEAETKKEGR